MGDSDRLLVIAAGNITVRGNNIHHIALWKRTYQAAISFSGSGNVYEDASTQAIRRSLRSIDQPSARVHWVTRPEHTEWRLSVSVSLCLCLSVSVSVSLSEVGLS